MRRKQDFWDVTETILTTVLVVPAMMGFLWNLLVAVAAVELLKPLVFVNAAFSCTVYALFIDYWYARIKIAFGTKWHQCRHCKKWTWKK